MHWSGNSVCLREAVLGEKKKNDGASIPGF